jgi:hypothetical protein
MLSPLPRRSDWAYSFAHSPQPYQPSPKGLSGRPAHCPFRGLLGVYSRYGLHTRAVTVYRDRLTRGFSHFVTSMTAPVASGWSGCRVGLAPTGKAPPFHGAHPKRTWRQSPRSKSGWRLSRLSCQFAYLKTPFGQIDPTRMAKAIFTKSATPNWRTAEDAQCKVSAIGAGL